MLFILFGIGILILFSTVLMLDSCEGAKTRAVYDQPRLLNN